MWPWRRRAAVVAPTPRPAFDAVVDLGPAAMLGLTVEAAMMAAETAVRAIPGAARVRVRIGNGPAPIGVRVFPPGSAEERTGEPWTGFRIAVQAAAATAVSSPGLAKPIVAAPVAIAPIRIARGLFASDRLGPLAAGAGFAEAPLHFDALAELAALAQSVRQPAPAPTPPSTPSPTPSPGSSREADVAMVARLLALVLPTNDRATALAAVMRFGSYAAMLAAPEVELRTVPGLGPHSVAAIKLVHEAAVRLARAGVTGQPVLDDPARLAAYLSAAVGRARVEQFRILFLDERGMLRADEVQATGTVNHTPVYPREVVRRALELEAAAIVLVHNHPSGDPTPSSDDITMTAEIRRAANALGIEVRDHIIVGNGRTLSFRDAGLLG